MFLMLSYFFFSYPSRTCIYTLSLHDALPILVLEIPEGRLVDAALRQAAIQRDLLEEVVDQDGDVVLPVALDRDRKSTRLNSSHRCISYAVFCLKKKIKGDVLATDSNTVVIGD